MRAVRKESGVVGCVSMQNKEIRFYINKLIRKCKGQLNGRMAWIETKK